MSDVLIALVSLFYVGVLFAVAWYGDRNSRTLAQRWQPWIYSLSLAVYCTSWTFFGAVGQAALEPWSFLPIYMAPILVFILSRRLLNITSIADFLAASYGKSRLVAAVVTVLLMCGIFPYVALQLKAIVMGYILLSVNSGVLMVSSTARER